MDFIWGYGRMFGSFSEAQPLHLTSTSLHTMFILLLPLQNHSLPLHGCFLWWRQSYCRHMLPVRSVADMLRMYVCLSVSTVFFLVAHVLWNNKWWSLGKRKCVCVCVCVQKTNVIQYSVCVSWPKGKSVSAPHDPTHPQSV